MDYYLLSDLTVRIGYELAVGGAETFRIEDTMKRLMHAYGVDCQTFAIPNCVMISLETDSGKPLMVMKRVGFHGTDLEAVEQLNALSRRICTQTPDAETAECWLRETLSHCRTYPLPVYYLGNLLAAAGFCLVFGGTLHDCLWAGLLGLIIGFVMHQMGKMEVNPLFSTITAAFAMAAPAYLAAGFGLVDSVNAVIIGALMLLVPGLLITNSMRDIIYGDTNSGINRIVQVLLSALAIAMGTAAAWHVTASVYGQVATATVTYPAWAQALAAGIACAGFFILFNVHDWGSILCALGGALTYLAYLVLRENGCGIYAANFFAAVIAAAYAESMARWRHYPVTSYLVISSIPLLPGAGIYYTMNLALSGSMEQAALKGLETAGVAGSIAAAILLVSTLFRLWTTLRKRHAG